MNTGARLGLYGAGLVVAFGGAFGIAGALVPDSVVTNWTEQANMQEHSESGGAAAHESTPAAAPAALPGLAISAGGFVLADVTAPARTGEQGQLSFQIQDASGAAVTEFTTAHEKGLHLIVARSDGSEFRHVHPVLDHATGTWTTPWEWDAAGSYRVFTDFTSAAGSALTLSSIVQVAGDFTPVAPQPTAVSEVDGFTVSLDGELAAGTSSELVISVSRGGEPVTSLEPYLGAFGHLVALREGDLAFLHVHADGADPAPGQTAGPEIVFFAEAPTAGRYLLYLDFQVDGKVHTAEFVLDAPHAAPDAAPSAAPDASHGDAH
ncbi:heavy-metal-associated domain-containing protein [Leucobacter luti]|uniref:heavy-metal-associated domain-containing protein n=1 Tax=Leucobacter luti TaxID=340320 RepID=UPI001C690E4D|nr:heavy-metal-associated domain-containing protein [Leucobacter luti]QYM76806.1 heavy-metal-associated domain-containing protein [Leucobacter luti]